MLVTVQLTPSQVNYLNFLIAHQIKEEKREFISLNQAYQRFGRSNVDRWIHDRIIKQYKRPGKIELSLKELLRAAYNEQDYL